MKLHNRTAQFVALTAPLAMMDTASAQLLLNGDLESLTVGTPPDCAVPAGAWEFPANYVTAVLCEALPTEAEIAGDPLGRGNAIHFNHNNAATNVHLTNLLTSVINEAPGLIVTVKFDVWVPTPGVAGGSIYIGGDHGAGGFSNATDRGPQLTFQADGRLTARDGATGLDVLILQAYAVSEWQTLQLDIDMTADTFDASWGPQNGALNVVATGVPYRSIVLDHIDRFSLAHFGALNAVEEMFVDNVSVERSGGCPCACEFDTSTGIGVCDVFDFLAFQNGFVGADPCACDKDTSTGAGVCDVFDFLAFQNEFVGGCP